MSLNWDKLGGARIIHCWQTDIEVRADDGRDRIGHNIAVI